VHLEAASLVVEFCAEDERVCLVEVGGRSRVEGGRIRGISALDPNGGGVVVRVEGTLCLGGGANSVHGVAREREVCCEEEVVARVVGVRAANVEPIAGFAHWLDHLYVVPAVEVLGEAEFG